MKKFLCALLLVSVLSVSAGIASAEDVYRIGVLRFANRARGLSDSQAAAITDIFTRMITNSRAIAVIERDQLEAIGREHRLSMSGLVDSRMAVQVGRLAGCQYMIMGSVTQFESKKSTQGFSNLFSETNYEAEVTIDMRVVDVTTAEVVLSMAETGTANQKTSSANIWDVHTSESVSVSGIEGKAVEDAVTKLGIRIRETVAGEYLQVLSAGGKEITLSVGATSGARKDSLYRVYAEGDSVLDMQGNVIGRKTITIAVVKINNVHSEFSTATVVKDGGNPSLIHRGDKITPISPGEAKDLAKRKDFAKQRPRSSLGSDIEGLDQALSTASTASVQPAPTAPQSYQPEPPAPRQPSGNSRPAMIASSGNFENYSTDPAKVIPTYGLPSGEANTLRIQHINIRRRYGDSKRAYSEYMNILGNYPRDYLAAYKAGEIARSIGDEINSRKWLEKALEINPNYEPAKKMLSRASSSGSGRSSKKRRK